ncbi:MAG TPA: efflux RND transporter periplasmic adaptor subunit [Sphingomicrobium sp.]|nr:efflux RND transporter periplasmic adaptor subunit [Sphingomicrobium sp.]
MNRQTPIRSSDSDTLVVVDDGARRRKRMAIIGAALIAVVALIIAMMMMGGNKEKAGEAAAGSGQLPTVSFVVPGREAVGRAVTASGPLAAKRDQPVGIAGQGGKVVRILVDSGSWVRAGQVLAVIDRSVQAQQAAQLAAQVQAAKANADLAQSNYDRALALKDRGFVSTADLEAKKATRDAALAQVKVAQAQLAETRAQIGQLNVTAPTSGLVLDRNVELGQIVGPGSGALFRIAEGGQMEMRAQLAQQDISFVHVGMPAQVTPVGADHSIPGTVWQVAPIIDPQSRLGEVRISVPYDKSIRPGGYAEAKIVAGSTAAPVLPQSAVLSDDNGNYVYVINGKDEIERRGITIGNVSDAGVTIAQGLSGQERVVLSAGPFLNPGQKVHPRRESESQALSSVE